MGKSKSDTNTEIVRMTLAEVKLMSKSCDPGDVQHGLELRAKAKVLEEQAKVLKQQANALLHPALLVLEAEIGSPGLMVVSPKLGNASIVRKSNTRVDIKVVKETLVGKGVEAAIVAEAVEEGTKRSESEYVLYKLYKGE